MSFDLMLPEIIADFDNKSPLTKELITSRRTRIVELEKALSGVDGAYSMDEFNEGKITHHFGTGVYGRELFIPKGNVIVSKIHRGKTLNVIAMGRISVICPNNGFNTYVAPYTFVSAPFTKRVVIAHEDTIWITSHATTQTDLNKIEDEIIATSFELESAEDKKCFAI